MNNPITLFDYNADWALKEGYLDPKPVPGYLTREEVIESYRVLDVNGVEIREDYWGDCTTKYLRSITWERGLPINSYVFTVDLSLPSDELRQRAVDRVYNLLDKVHSIVDGRKSDSIVDIEGLVASTLGRWHPFFCMMAPGKPMSRASQVASDATLDIGFPSAKACKYERMALLVALSVRISRKPSTML